MRDIPVCVPCYRKGICKTLDIVPDAILFMDSKDYPIYRERYPNANIVVVPDEAQGNCPRIHNYIMDYMFKDYEAICFMDDDVTDLYRLGVEKTERGSRGKIRQSVLSYFDEFVEKYTTMCDDMGLKMWGTNQFYDNIMQFEPYSTKKFVGSPFCVHIKHPLRYDENLYLYEEYDMILQQCNKYRGVLRLNLYVVEFGLADTVGGTSSFRNQLIAQKQIDKLLAKWGKCVSTKKVKSSPRVFLRVPIRGL